MKIVQIEDYFHPEAGYQINILSKYMAKAGHDVVIVTASLENCPDDTLSIFDKSNIEEKDARYSSKYNVRIIRIPVKKVVFGRVLFDKKIFKIIADEKPDILYVHGNDTLIGMQCLLKYRNWGLPMIMDSHMLEMASANKFNKIYRKAYKAIFTPIIVKNHIQVIRTQNDPYVEECLGIPLAQAPWISVGSDTLLFYPDKEKKEEFRKKNGIKADDFVVLYAGKLNENKGGMLLAEGIKKKIASPKNVVFCIVGNTTDEYGERVEKLFKESENRILRFPTQKYEDLAAFYRAADLAVFPRQCSLSFYDVQACGLPVLFEDNNVNIGRAQCGNAITFAAESVESFKEKLAEFVNMDLSQLELMGQHAKKYVEEEFDYKKIADAYMDLIEAEATRQKGLK